MPHAEGHSPDKRLEAVGPRTWRLSYVQKHNGESTKRKEQCRCRSPSTKVHKSRGGPRQKYETSIVLPSHFLLAVRAVFLQPFNIIPNSFKFNLERMSKMPPVEQLSAPNWRRHEVEILDLFATRNKTWKEVQKHMEEQYGFIARYLMFPKTGALHVLVGGVLRCLSNSVDRFLQRETIQVPFQSFQETIRRRLCRHRPRSSASCRPRQEDRRFSS